MFWNLELSKVKKNKPRLLSKFKQVRPINNSLFTCCLIDIQCAKISQDKSGRDLVFLVTVYPGQGTEADPGENCREDELCAPWHWCGCSYQGLPPGNYLVKEALRYRNKLSPMYSEYSFCLQLVGEKNMTFEKDVVLFSNLKLHFQHDCG